MVLNKFKICTENKIYALSLDKEIILEVKAV